MPWVTVKNFDKDVRIGDKLKSDDTYDSRVFKVTGIGETIFLAIHDYETDYKKSHHWLVWRETKRWRAENGEYYWYADRDFGIKIDADFRTSVDDLHFNSMNYFMTSYQAAQYADECKKLADRLHKKWNE